jgi:hypothetical protein
MSDAQPVAATLEEIEAAYPKAKPDFVLACLKKRMPMASVATAAVEEMMRENAELKAQIAAMQEEMGKAKSVEHGDMETEEKEEVQEMAQAKAKGVKPVAKTKTSGPTAGVRWDGAVEACVPKCNGNKMKAVAMANKQNPGLRQAYLDEVNAGK